MMCDPETCSTCRLIRTIQNTLIAQWRAQRDAEMGAALGGCGGPWFCDECGGVMSVDPAGVSLCAPCSAAREGKVPCPADHQGNKKACPLCRGAGFVEALT